MEAKVPGPGSQHGIYIYSPGEGGWKIHRVDGGALDPKELGDGVVVVYFDNALCPACRLQDRYWLEVVNKYSGDGRVRFVVVLCDWFSQNCSSKAAAESFNHHRIGASPTIAVFAVKNGEVVYKEYLEGVRPANIIALYIDRALKAYTG
ncbi:TlpA family protein disulfide reductase [Aeropyrum camini]|uniref:Thioredoxin domain-containing protein n=2 Tax=Aeropyrum camini TaxID=229980 RepID=U3TCA7_9CREN|nr:thioredoxin family protein [Aeropyrum camini]BAN89655.1 hypothetical protein ACAM_0186 [Aeropyrum camini SY1 = JCM 12091]